MPKYDSPRANGFRAEIAVLRPEGVFPYVEWEETTIVTKSDSRELFVEIMLTYTKRVRSVIRYPR